jgi:hypothetical protein
VVTLGAAPACTCPGFQHHGRCYHLQTALTRFPALYSRPAAVIVRATDPEPPTPAAPAAFPVAGTYIPGHAFTIGGRQATGFARARSARRRA